MSEIAVVIGARGLGYASARRLGVGRKLLLGDVSVELVAEGARALRLDGFDVETCVVDVADRRSVADFAAQAAGLGSMRAMMVAAGLSPRSADPQRILEVNMLGMVHVIDAFTPLVGPGTAAVLLSSNAAYYKSIPPEIERQFALAEASELVAVAKQVKGWDTGLGAYWLAKRCNQLRVEAAAASWGARGGRIMTISPGIISTPMIIYEREIGSPVDESVAGTPLGRIGVPEDIAAAVEWLVGAGASLITGTDLRIDGGMVAAMRWCGLDIEDPTDARKQTAAPVGG